MGCQKTFSDTLRKSRTDYQARSVQWASQIPETFSFLGIGSALARPLSEGLPMETSKKDFPKSFESLLFGNVFLAFPKRKSIVLIRFHFAMTGAGRLGKESSQISHRHRLSLAGGTAFYKFSWAH